MIKKAKQAIVQAPMMRHLPPVAPSVTAAALRAGIRPDPAALDHFRGALARYLKLTTEACFLASSGRTALHYLLGYLKAAGRGRSTVIMPAYTCPVLARVTLDLGLRPKFVDISPESFHFVNGGITAALDAQTLAIIAVHPFGIPQPIEDLRELAAAAGAFLIEDAAQALGARWGGRAAGTQADFGLFSLGPGKPLSTAGGGVLVVNSADHLESLKRWWQAMPLTPSLVSGTAWARQVMFQMIFHPRGWWAATRLGLHTVGDEASSWGYKDLGLAPSQAAVGTELLFSLEGVNTQRRQKAQALMQDLENSPFFSFPKSDDLAQSIYLRLPLITGSETIRKQLFQGLWAAGIGVGRLYKQSLPALFDPAQRDNYPGAETVARCLLTLPTHHYVTAADIQAMRQLLRRQHAPPRTATGEK